MRIIPPTNTFVTCYRAAGYRDAAVENTKSKKGQWFGAKNKRNFCFFDQPKHSRQRGLLINFIVRTDRSGYMSRKSDRTSTSLFREELFLYAKAVGGRCIKPALRKARYAECAAPF